MDNAIENSNDIQGSEVTLILELTCPNWEQMMDLLRYIQSFNGAISMKSNYNYHGFNDILDVNNEEELRLKLKDINIPKPEENSRNPITELEIE